MLRFIFVLFFCSWLAGCASFISSRTAELADNLATAVLNSNDPATVRDGAPAYLLMIDGMIAGDQKNVRLLQAGANLYSAYASVFVDDDERRKRLMDKAMEYASSALCISYPTLCEIRAMPYKMISKILKNAPEKLVPHLHTMGVTWVGWIQAHKGDWNAVAKLSTVKLILETVVRLDEPYRDGISHLYLGGLATLLPPALGGKPETGRVHFERAILLSNSKNLFAKVSFAERYGRLVFDRQLHDRLLQEVIDADPVASDYTLMNVIAQEQARKLLASANDYF